MEEKRIVEKGWIYRGHQAIPVQILGEFNRKTWCVRFPTRKLGLRGHVGVVGKGGVSLHPPHVIGRAR